jgi:hypothetical protein
VEYTIIACDTQWETSHLSISWINCFIKQLDPGFSTIYS